MSDIKLFRLTDTAALELESHSVALEKSLQRQIEKHLDVLIGVKFLATEHSTGVKHGGRIDTLGIDENGCPVIIEYKRALNENVINQGLYYLDWLMDHKAEFELLVQRKLGAKVAGEIEWSTPRLVCVAGEFTKYDAYAVQQINRNIELLRYRKYGKDLLLFELVNAAEATKPSAASESGRAVTSTKAEKGSRADKGRYKHFTDYLAQSPEDLQDRFEAFRAFALALGEDVQEKQLKFYVAFKRLKNFCCVEVHPKTNSLILFVKADLAAFKFEPGFSRDVTSVGHFGTGNLELTIRSTADLEKAKAFVVLSYEAN